MRRRRIIRRLRLAWHILIRGTLPGSRDQVEVPVSDLTIFAERVFGIAGLPRDWPARATSEELEIVGAAIKYTGLVRERAWQTFEQDINAPAPVSASQGR